MHGLPDAEQSLVSEVRAVCPRHREHGVSEACVPTLGIPAILAESALEVSVVSSLQMGTCVS